jgi:hypothetical protein
MPVIRQFVLKARQLCGSCTQSAGVFLRDVSSGMLEVSHNTLALLGLIAVALLIFVAGRSELRQSLEDSALSWLQARQEARADPLDLLANELGEPDAIARATASDPKDLTLKQAAVAQWLSRRYRVAPEPVSRLVLEAWHVGAKTGLDPTLILAIMAIESSFNPFAQSAVGAQGLMQVMTHVHDDKYERFGGTMAAFDPVTNLRVGVQVLKECISRAGGIEAGLRLYVGAGNLSSDDGYALKVLAEQSHLLAVAAGKLVAFNASNGLPAQPPLPLPGGTPSLTPEPAQDTDAAVSSEQVASLR